MIMIKKETVLASLVLFVCVILMFNISFPCFAQGDLQNDVDEHPIEMLDATDVQSAIEQMKQDYYDPLDEMTLLKKFVEGAKIHASDEAKPDILKTYKPGDSFKNSIKNLEKAFKGSGLKQRDWQRYIQSGLRYMVDSLGNEGCEYSSPGRYRQTLQEMGYNKGGCGFFVDEKRRDSDGRWIIIETLQDFPAEKEGIRSGDRLISVNGRNVRKMTFKRLARVVRGPVGSNVTLLVYRPSDDKEIKISIKRTWLGPNPKSIKAEILPGNIGYIKIRYLGERMDSIIEEIHEDFAKKNVKSVIWDMRNSAGMMEGATDLASYYAPVDKVFAWRVFLDSDSSYKGKADQLKYKPDVILMNRYTSATSAFVALVLKEYHKIPLVGRSMQWDDDDTKSFRLRDDSHIRITYSYYKLADGTILKNGAEVKPDIDVVQHPLPPYENGDKQLEKALELLKDKK